MGRGGKVSAKRNFKKRLRSKDMGSDESDEDYVVSNEENGVSNDSEDDYASLDRDASEESFGNYVEEVEEEEVRNIVRSREKKGNLSRRNNGVRGPKRRGKKMLYDKEENEGYDDDDDEEVAEEEFARPRKRKRALSNEENDDDYDNEDYDDEDDDDDEEFTIDEEEEDCFGEEEKPMVRKRSSNKKVGRRGSQRKRSGRGRKRRKKSMVTEKSLGKKGRKNRGLRRKSRFGDDDVDFVDKSPIVREKGKKVSENMVQRKRRYVAQSDSDFVVSSGTSDFEYTISEEEREQIREASELCRSLTTSLRSSKRIQEGGDPCQPGNPPVRKGKEKVEEVKKINRDVGKQVCGICLSEEDKIKVRGTLNCCSHYFCFACIMEWSKVESRCPLCKQRFKTISKPARSNMGVDLRDAVIQIPERDQVYQPSEEEIRGYLDPYENVICSECHQGGDDGLMLLCDLCDSSAHTYCVGLGHEVPEGNWYCDGCRPVALGSSSSQGQEHLPDQRITSNYLSNRPPPFRNVREELDLNSVPSPHTPFTQRFGILSSPRFPVGDAQAASPVPGAGGPTLSGRRWRHRQIQNFLSTRMGFMTGRANGISAANSSRAIFNSTTDQGRETAFQHTRTQDSGTLHHTFLEERSQDNPSILVQNTDLPSSRLNHLRREPVQDPSTTTTNGSGNGTFWAELARGNLVSGHEQLRLGSSRSSIGSDGSVSPFTVREESHFYAAKEQVQSMVKSHLSDIDLGHSMFKDIARQSTHTILAACGLEHRRSQVHCLPPPSACSHIERVGTGQTSLMKGFCSSCFDSFVRDVVKTILNSRLPSWLVGSRI